MIVQVDAPNLEEAFVQAGMAVADTTVNVPSVCQVRSMAVEASGSDMRHMLYSWLEEIIYKMITEGFAISRIEVDKLDREKYSIHGIIHGEPIDLKKHGFKVEIKAPTFHEMQIKENSKGASMLFLLDL